MRRPPLVTGLTRLNHPTKESAIFASHTQDAKLRVYDRGGSPTNTKSLRAYHITKSLSVGGVCIYTAADSQGFTDFCEAAGAEILGKVAIRYGTYRIL